MKDNFVFLFKIDKKPQSFLKVDTIAKELMHQSIEKFHKELKDFSGIDFKLDNRDNGFLNIWIVSENYSPLTNDWYPQIAFRSCNKNKGVLFHSLKLPKELRGKGIGRFCVNWLKNFCQKYNFDYIVLGSYEGAYDFWCKMGFQRIEGREARNYYP